MGNIGSGGGNGNSRRRSRSHNHNSQPPPPPTQPPSPHELAGNRFFTPPTTYPDQYPNPNPPPYYPYAGYYAPPPVPLPGPYDRHHYRGIEVPNVDPAHANWIIGRHPCGPAPPPLAPYVEHQKAVTIRNDLNLKKETLRMERDEENPGQFLVAFTFDATVAGR